MTKMLRIFAIGLFGLSLVLAVSLSAQDSAATPTITVTPDAGATPLPYAVGNELTVAAVQDYVKTLQGSDIIIEQALENGANYARYIASYLSDGFKIYGLLTIPFGDVPDGGFKAIVFNHGYIPPHLYVTTERYLAYVDTLALNGFVVFKIDLRGHGDSEGEARGSYFSPNYTIDAVAALRSLQKMAIIDPDGIGIWGHSMGGNLALRAMLVEPAFKAGVIWAGAVYSYTDFEQYAITDNSFVPQPNLSPFSRRDEIFQTFGRPNAAEPYWQAVSLTNHLDLLHSPLQIHHATNDDVVNIGYSRDLAAVLQSAGKSYEYYEYDSGGHNIGSPAFETAMQRTVAFFLTHL